MTSLSEVDSKANKLDARLTVIEALFQQGKGSEVKPETVTKMRADLDSLNRDMLGLKATQTWFVRIIMGALIMAFLTFALQGGLVTTPKMSPMEMH